MGIDKLLFLCDTAVFYFRMLFIKLLNAYRICDKLLLKLASCLSKL